MTDEEVESALTEVPGIVDLPMALALPLAMLREGELSGETLESIPRIEVFEALRRLIPCYRVFCDAGGMYPPPRRRLRILPLLDSVIVPVSMPALPSGRRPAFHPKLILLRFVRDGARYGCEGGAGGRLTRPAFGRASASMAPA